MKYRPLIQLPSYWVSLLAGISLLSSSSSSPTTITNAWNHNALKTPKICGRSNATHIVWNIHTTPTTQPQQWATMPAFGRRRSQVLTTSDSGGSSDVHNTTTSSSSSCHVQTYADAHQTCLTFLKDNLMAFDQPFQETMGFPKSSTKNDDEPDGLGNGMIGATIQLALQAKIDYEWTDVLSQDVFFNYVLNYANLNEARNNWRPLIVDALRFNESDLYQNNKNNITTSDVVTWVNTHLWTQLARSPDHPIRFVSSQTPLIFDPMSIIAFGYASCTGTSILFTNALRAVGIPARVAGTPAWYGKASNGNHNWVEVYDNGDWKFLEPSPALAHVDTLDADPCSRWFCKPNRYPSSRVYAAQMKKRRNKQGGEKDDDASILPFPLAWEWDCQDVPAVDRTDYYTQICSSCGVEESE